MHIGYRAEHHTTREIIEMATTATTDRKNTKTHQMTMELIRVLDRWWLGDGAQFDQFSRMYLTNKGMELAKSIPVGTEGDQLYRLAQQATTAGY